MEQDAIIIKLAPHQESPQAVSFDQAFGAHSEARGKGAARRAAKKKTKGNRLGRAALAVATGGLVGGVIKTGPQARADRHAKKLERIARKGEAQAARQSNRDAQQESRQSRKDIRKSRKVARKELAPEEAPEIVDEEQDYTPESEAEYEDPEQEEQAAEEEEQEVEQEEGEYQESFEGEFAHSAAGMPEIHSEIRGITEKIVWNKEAMRRRQGEKGKLVAATKNLAKTNRNNRDVSANSGVIQGHDVIIQKHEARIKELELGLKKFGAHPHIPEGYRQAQSKLQKGLEKKVAARDKAVIKETLVPGSLQPEISTQRIKVPSTPGMKTVELTSKFEGPAVIKGLSTQTKVLLGIAVLGIAYAVAKKYKYI